MLALVLLGAVLAFRKLSKPLSYTMKGIGSIKEENDYESFFYLRVLV